MKIKDQYGNTIGEVEESGGNGCVGTCIAICIVLAFILSSCGLLQ